MQAIGIRWRPFTKFRVGSSIRFRMMACVIKRKWRSACYQAVGETTQRNKVMARSIKSDISIGRKDAEMWYEQAKAYGNSSLLVTIPSNVPLRQGESRNRIISRSASRDLAVARLVAAIAT